jgi:hypothetical protein
MPKWRGRGQAESATNQSQARAKRSGSPARAPCLQYMPCIRLPPMGPSPVAAVPVEYTHVCVVCVPILTVSARGRVWVLGRLPDGGQSVLRDALPDARRAATGGPKAAQ